MISATLEFGTYPVREVLHALLADNWLHAHGDVESPLGREIKADIRKRLFPDEDDWKERVLVQGTEILNRTLRGSAKRDRRRTRQWVQLPSRPKRKLSA